MDIINNYIPPSGAELFLVVRIAGFLPPALGEAWLLQCAAVEHCQRGDCSYQRVLSTAGSMQRRRETRSGIG